jgi:hypothetical protein
MFGASIAESPDSTRRMTKVHSQEELDNAVAIKGSEEPNAHDASAAYTALQNFNKKIVTHLVYRTAGTAKFESANKDPAIRVVPLAWLEQCILQYRRLPEEDFALAAFSHTGKPSLFDENQAALRVNDLIENKRLVLAEAVARKRAADAQNDDDEEEDEEEKEKEEEDEGKKFSNTLGLMRDLPEEVGDDEEEEQGQNFEDFGAELEAYDEF